MAPYAINIEINIDMQTKWSQIVPRIRSENYYNCNLIKRNNRYCYLLNFDNFCEEQFGSYVKSHDQYNHKNKLAQYKSVSNFVHNTEKQQPRLTPVDKCYRIQLGNQDTYWYYVMRLTKSIMRHTTKSEIESSLLALDIITSGFEKYAREFHEHNPYLYMFEAYIQQSIDSPIHLHGRIMALVPHSGHLNSGILKRPNLALNIALAKQYHITQDRTKTFAKFKRREARNLVNAINETAKTKVGIDTRLTTVSHAPQMNEDTLIKYQEKRKTLFEQLINIEHNI